MSPNDDMIHTQNLENIWSRMKNKIRRLYGTSKELSSSYLIEFIWRERFKRKDTFSSNLASISIVYCLDL